MDSLKLIEEQYADESPSASSVVRRAEGLDLGGVANETATTEGLDLGVEEKAAITDGSLTGEETEQKEAAAEPVSDDVEPVNTEGAVTGSTALDGAIVAVDGATNQVSTAVNLLTSSFTAPNVAAEGATDQVSTAVNLLTSSFAAQNADSEDEHSVRGSNSVRVDFDPYEGYKFPGMLHKFMTSEQEFLKFVKIGDADGVQFCSVAKFEEFKKEFKKSKSERKLPRDFPDKYMLFPQRMRYHKFERQVSGNSDDVERAAAADDGEGTSAGPPSYKYLDGEFQHDTKFEKKQKKKPKGKENNSKGKEKMN